MKPIVKCLLMLSALLFISPARTQQGSIMIETVDSSVTTREGCYEELHCTGVGTKISWRIFGIKIDITNDTTEPFYVITESEPYPDDNTGTVSRWTSRLIFRNVSTSNANSYSCTLFNDIPGEDIAPVAASVQMYVLPGIVAIEPEIGNRNISSYTVGDTLLVGCPVQTCASGITVEFHHNDALVATGMPSSTQERVYTMNLPITTESQGTYYCRVVTQHPHAMVSQAFNITGDPIVPPTLPPGETPPVTTRAIRDTATTDSSALSLLPSLWLLLISLFCAFKS